MTADGTPTPRTGETITVPRPHVLHGPIGVPADRADADYLRSAARNIEHRADAVRSLWGSGVTAMVVRLLTDAADAIERPDAQQPARTDAAVERLGAATKALGDVPTTAREEANRQVALIIAAQHEGETHA